MEPTYPHSPVPERQNGLRNNVLIPLSIIIGCALIAGAMVYIKIHDTSASSASLAGLNASAHPEDSMPAVSAADHILGNPNAPVILVEYADTDCPFCQAFNPTLHRIIDQYGPSGQVAWVYRHFAFHPNAPKEAEASECVAELGGNDAFWKYIDLLFSKKDFTKNPYVPMSPSQLPVLASSIGIDKAKFTSCLDSGKYKTKIDTEYNDAVSAGAQGTPYTVIVTRNGKIPITTGAVSYDVLNAAIQSLLKP